MRRFRKLGEKHGCFLSHFLFTETLPGANRHRQHPHKRTLSCIDKMHWWNHAVQCRRPLFFGPGYAKRIYSYFCIIFSCHTLVLRSWTHCPALRSDKNARRGDTIHTNQQMQTWILAIYQNSHLHHFTPYFAEYNPCDILWHPSALLQRFQARRSRCLGSCSWACSCQFDFAESGGFPRFEDEQRMKKDEKKHDCGTQSTEWFGSNHHCGFW